MKLNILPITALLTAVSSANAAITLMETDFDLLPSGAVTTANLNTATTNGTWALNTGRGATYTRSGAANDYALLADDADGGNANVISFATITLAAVADFTTDAVTWSFNTATRRTGVNKGLRYEFLSGATSVATLDWVEGGGLTLTGTGPDGTGNSAFAFLFAWNETDAAARSLSATFAGTNLNLNFEDQSLSVALGSSTIDRLVISSTGSENAGAKGVFLDDMLVTQVPEPSSALLAGIGALFLLHRRRSA